MPLRARRRPKGLRRSLESAIAERVRRRTSGELRAGHRRSVHRSNRSSYRSSRHSWAIHPRSHTCRCRHSRPSCNRDRRSGRSRARRTNCRSNNSVKCSPVDKPDPRSRSSLDGIRRHSRIPRAGRTTNTRFAGWTRTGRRNLQAADRACIDSLRTKTLAGNEHRSGRRSSHNPR